MGLNLHEWSGSAMIPLSQKLKSLFHFRGKQQLEEATIRDILQKGFLRLRNADPQTEQQWLRLQRAIEQGNAAATRIKSRLIPRLAFGAAIVAIAMLGVYVYFSAKQHPPDTFTTQKGQQKEVVLGDGSQITLSYATELVVPKLQLGKPRRVSLTGEAYFRVRQSETPFIVSTQYAEVEVVGTEFNLRAHGGALEVAVISGMVKVSLAKGGKDSTLLLTQHQMAVCLRDGFPMRIGDIPSPEYPGWMHGKLFLNRTSFLAAAREIEMRFDVAIAIDDPNLHSEIITGVLDVKNAESALIALCSLAGKRFKHDGHEFKIY